MGQTLDMVFMSSLSGHERLFCSTEHVWKEAIPVDNDLRMCVQWNNSSVDSVLDDMCTMIVIHAPYSIFR